MVDVSNFSRILKSLESEIIEVEDMAGISLISITRIVSVISIVKVRGICLKGQEERDFSYFKHFTNLL